MCTLMESSARPSGQDLAQTLNELPWFCKDQSAVSGLHRYYSGIVSSVQAAETLGSLGSKP